MQTFNHILDKLHIDTLRRQIRYADSVLNRLADSYINESLTTTEFVSVGSRIVGKYDNLTQEQQAIQQQRFYELVEKHTKAGKLLPHALASLELLLDTRVDESAQQEPDEDVFKEWKKLINMTAGELQKFLDDYGKEAGLSKKEADGAGVDSGRDSAKWILKMLPNSSSFEKASKNWTPTMWEWARKQNSFNNRMLGAKKNMKPPYYERDGKLTRWHMSLKLWGHDPKK